MATELFPSLALFSSVVSQKKKKKKNARLSTVHAKVEKCLASLGFIVFCPFAIISFSNSGTSGLFERERTRNLRHSCLVAWLKKKEKRISGASARFKQLQGSQRDMPVDYCLLRGNCIFYNVVVFHLSEVTFFRYKLHHASFDQSSFVPKKLVILRL